MSCGNFPSVADVLQCSKITGIILTMSSVKQISKFPFVELIISIIISLHENKILRETAIAQHLTIPSHLAECGDLMKRKTIAFEGLEIGRK